MRHHEVQQKGRDEILADYHLRVGQITADHRLPEGCTLAEQQLDETKVGEGTAVTLINATRPPEWKETNSPYDWAEWLGLNPWAFDSTSWDIFFAKDNARSRRVRVIRDYRKYDRREAPQHSPDASGAETIHA